MKERVGGRQRSFFFLLVFSCLEILLIAGKALALCSAGSRRGARDPPPPSSYFLAQTEARRAEKKMFRDRAPPYLWVWMTPPPSLSERLHPPLLCQSKFLALSHFVYIGQSILSAQLINVHFVCATLTTPVCLSFFYQTGTDLSSSQSRFVSSFSSVFNLVA